MIIKMLFIVIFSVCCAGSAFPRDFVVEFVEENYKETQMSFSYKPLIYHSLQVDTGAGPKVLVLTGDDYTYRTWLRHYIADNKQFLASVEEDRIDEFISNKVFEISLTSIHPFNLSKWEPGNKNKNEKTTVQGTANILIVDQNKKRVALMTSLLRKMNFKTIVFPSVSEAMNVFELQPEKFKMVMIRHGRDLAATQSFVSSVIRTNHTMPVVIDVAYQQDQVRAELASIFSKSASVLVKSLVLQELPKTVSQLMGSKG